jgi:hypothetical protein
MSGLQWVIGWACTLECFALFAILVYRKHYRRLPVFTLYAAAIALNGLALGIAYTLNAWIWEAWLIGQVVVAALRFGVALELSQVIFGAFRAAAVTARRVIFVILIVTAFTAMSVTGPGVTYHQFNGEMVPRLATGAIWILTALAALVLWYRLPLGDLQKAVLMAYAPYLLIFTVGMNVLTSSGWHLRFWVGYVDTLSFSALLLYWCRVAWRTAAETSRPDPPASDGMGDHRLLTRSDAAGGM